MIRWNILSTLEPSETNDEGIAILTSPDHSVSKSTNDEGIAILTSPDHLVSKGIHSFKISFEITSSLENVRINVFDFAMMHLRWFEISFCPEFYHQRCQIYWVNKCLRSTYSLIIRWIGCRETDRLCVIYNRFWIRYWAPTKTGTWEYHQKPCKNAKYTHSREDFVGFSYWTGCRDGKKWWEFSLFTLDFSQQS